MNSYRLPSEIVEDLRDKVRLRIRSLRDWRKGCELFGTEKTRDIQAAHKSVLESRFLEAWADYRELKRLDNPLFFTSHPEKFEQTQIANSPTAQKRGSRK